MQHLNQAKSQLSRMNCYKNECVENQISTVGVELSTKRVLCLKEARNSAFSSPASQWSPCFNVQCSYTEKLFNPFIPEVAQSYNVACERRRISGGRFYPLKNSVCETELQNDFCNVKFLVNQS